MRQSYYNNVFTKYQAIKYNQPLRLPGLKPGVYSGLVLSGAFYPDLKIGDWRRRMYQKVTCPLLFHPTDLFNRLVERGIRVNLVIDPIAGLHPLDNAKIDQIF